MTATRLPLCPHPPALATPLVPALLTLLLSALVAGPALATTPPAPLEGVEWQLKSWRGADGMTAALAEPRTALRFAGGRVSGTLGCNRLSGAYERDGDRLTFAPHLAATMMACPPPVMAQEQAATAALQQAAGLRIVGAGLTILDAAGAPLLVFAANPGPALAGTRWLLQRYNNGRQAVVSVINGTAVGLQIGEDGQFAGRACNNFRGRFEISEGRMHLVGGIAATRMFCPEPAGAAEQEAAFLAALERVAGWQIRAGRLTLTDADAATLAVFTPE